jgi:hypothetical protein
MTPLHQAHLTPKKYSISNSSANHKKIIQQYLIRGLSTNGIWGTKIVNFPNNPQNSPLEGRDHYIESKSRKPLYLQI